MRAPGLAPLAYVYRAFRKRYGQRDLGDMEPRSCHGASPGAYRASWSGLARAAGGGVGRAVVGRHLSWTFPAHTFRPPADEPVPYAWQDGHFLQPEHVRVRSDADIDTIGDVGVSQAVAYIVRPFPRDPAIAGQADLRPANGGSGQEFHWGQAPLVGLK